MRPATSSGSNWNEAIRSITVITLAGSGGSDRGGARKWRMARKRLATARLIGRASVTEVDSTVSPRLRRLVGRHRSIIRCCALRVPRAFGRDLRGGAVDLAEVVGRELDVGRGDVLLQAVQLRRAGDRDDPRLLGEQPGERDLRGRCVLPFRDPGQQLDEGAIRLPGVRVEARDGVAEVVARRTRSSRRSSRSGSPCREG